jgi:hypothetical protein
LVENGMTKGPEAADPSATLQQAATRERGPARRVRGLLVGLWYAVFGCGVGSRLLVRFDLAVLVWSWWCGLNGQTSAVNPLSSATPLPGSETIGDRSHRRTPELSEQSGERSWAEGISSHSFRHAFASMLNTGLKYKAVTVSKQLGHKKPTTTLAIYAHEFEKARGQEELRSAMDAGLGHMLRDVNGMSASGRNRFNLRSPQVRPIRG